MKKSILFIIVISLFLSFSCSNEKKKNTLTKTTGQEVQKIEKDSTGSGKIYLTLKEGKGEAQIYKKKGETIYVYFQSTEKCKLYGELYAQDPTANIRFSQITLPDGTMDGPFGKNIEYDLPEPGEYKISINENIMAGDPWEGYFTVNIALD